MDKDQVFIFTYADIVKLAGHSCPAVSGAYKLTQKALKFLYENELPVRGEIKSAVLGMPADGANGPMAQVISFITGAALETGFHGLSGKFKRANKLIFDAENEEYGEFIFQREDTKKTIKIKYHPELIPQSNDMSKYYRRCLLKVATPQEEEIFINLWQEKVKKVLFEEVPGLFELIDTNYKF
ncbi:MAG: hypothetical protein HYU63_03645 [Armatimonadetes bacterium]|nr:hypothetical protein [Armatimonadota bacterium]